MKIKLWSKRRPRLAYPTASIPAIPEPDFRLTDGMGGWTPSIQQIEAWHADWHRDNPLRYCEYGSQLPGHPPPPPGDIEPHRPDPGQRGLSR